MNLCQMWRHTGKLLCAHTLATAQFSGGKVGVMALARSVRKALESTPNLVFQTRYNQRAG